VTERSEGTNELSTLVTGTTKEDSDRAERGNQ
jgi:hypothetical protein